MNGIFSVRLNYRTISLTSFMKHSALPAVKTMQDKLSWFFIKHFKEIWFYNLIWPILPDVLIFTISPYFNGKLIYSAFRLSINLNFTKLTLMTGFVVQGHTYKQSSDTKEVKGFVWIQCVLRALCFGVFKTWDRLVHTLSSGQGFWTSQEECKESQTSFRWSRGRSRSSWLRPRARGRFH